MKYVAVQTIDPIIRHAANTISTHLLAGKRVTWLLSGGSAIELEVRIAQALQTHDVSRLFISLVDERYGPVGHSNENYTQLMNAHFPLFITRVLTGDSPEKTAKNFGDKIATAIKNADYSLGIFGIGADGHTAGIKASSPATASTKPALYYEWDDHQRITLTPPTIQQLDEAIIYAFGSEKLATLRELVKKNTSIDKQPAQLLKHIAASTLYTDNDLDSTK